MESVTKRYSPILLILLFSAVLIAKPSVANLDKKSELLVSLRFEVDEASNSYDQLRNRFNLEISALENQIADTKQLLLAERSKKSALKKLQVEQQKATEAQRQINMRYEKPTLEVSKLLKNHIAKSIPFKTKERLASVTQITSDLQSQRIDATAALLRLWRVVEDELKLTQETGLYQQGITLSNEQLLVDVIRIGMSVLYFKTEDSRFGIARQDKSGHADYVEFTNPDEIAALRALFDAQKKQIRTGNFKLPLPSLEPVKKREP